MGNMMQERKRKTLKRPTWFTRFCRRLRKNQCGAGFIEYAIIIAIVVGIGVPLLMYLSDAARINVIYTVKVMTVGPKKANEWKIAEIAKLNPPETPPEVDHETNN